MTFNSNLKGILNEEYQPIKKISNRLAEDSTTKACEDQKQTSSVFSAKWNETSHGSKDFSVALEKQKRWYLELYGFRDEQHLAGYLQKCNFILDAGAGKCGKAAWFAELCPETTVIAADMSGSLYDAADYYTNLNNLYFIKCDISKMTFFKTGVFDYVSCDQVIHHTTDPYKTFKELVRVTSPLKELSVYVYRKKALPRELIDDYFREYSKHLSHEQLMALSEQLTLLGKNLTDIQQEIEIPPIPLLGIEGGRMNVQRFIYWNFLKCFWNEESGRHNSIMTNYDWYAPSQAFRYDENQFKTWFDDFNLQEIYFHKEPACYSARVRKPGPSQILQQNIRCQP